MARLEPRLLQASAPLSETTGRPFVVRVREIDNRPRYFCPLALAYVSIIAAHACDRCVSFNECVCASVPRCAADLGGPENGPTEQIYAYLCARQSTFCCVYAHLNEYQGCKSHSPVP